MEQEDAVEYAQKGACDTLGKWLSVEPAWLWHILATDGDCKCWFNEEMGHDYCEQWKQYQDVIFEEQHGMTKEEFARREAEKRRLQAELHAARRQRSIKELAIDQGIDPNLLP